MKDYLKKLRESKKKTQIEMAKALGISESQYIKIELGYRKPSFKTLISLKEYYKDEIDLNELFK